MQSINSQALLIKNKVIFSRYSLFIHIIKRTSFELVKRKPYSYSVQHISPFNPRKSTSMQQRKSLCTEVFSLLERVVKSAYKSHNQKAVHYLPPGLEWFNAVRPGFLSESEKICPFQNTLWIGFVYFLNRFSDLSYNSGVFCYNIVRYFCVCIHLP